MATRPGWYPDPEESDTVRWWNGLGWTSWRAEGAGAPPPPHGGDPRTVATVVPAADRERRHTLRTVLLALATVLVLVVAVAVFGSFQRAAHPVAGASTAPTAFGSPSQQAPDVGGDIATGSLVFAGELEVQLPGAPFETPTPYGSDLVSDGAACQFELHPDFYVSAVAGYLTEEIARPGDDAAAAAAVGAGVLSGWYTEEPSTGEPATGALGDLPAERASAWTVRTEVDAPELPTTSEEIRVAVVSLGDGRQVGLVTAVADDAPADAVAAVDGFWDGLILR